MFEGLHDPSYEPPPHDAFLTNSRHPIVAAAR
jgi:hypothetical protein